MNPENAETHNNSGNVLGLRLEEAIRHYQAAIRIRPDYAEAHNNLGIVLAGLGKYKEALRHFEKALRVEPDFAEARENIKILSSRIDDTP